MNSSAPAARAAASICSRRRLRAAEGDVLAHAAVQDERLLEQDRDVAAQRGELELAQVVAVEADRAPVGVVEADEHPGERRLAGAAGADQGQRLAGRDTQGDVVERGALGARVGESEPLDLDSPRARGRARRAGGRSVTRGSLVEQLDHPLGAGERLEEGVRERAEGADRRVELGQVGDEDEHAADRQRARGDGDGAEREHAEDPGELDQVDERGEQAVDP